MFDLHVLFMVWEIVIEGHWLIRTGQPRQHVREKPLLDNKNPLVQARRPLHQFVDNCLPRSRDRARLRRRRLDGPFNCVPRAGSTPKCPYFDPSWPVTECWPSRLNYGTAWVRHKGRRTDSLITFLALFFPIIFFFSFEKWFFFLFISLCVCIEPSVYRERFISWFPQHLAACKKFFWRCSCGIKLISVNQLTSSRRQSN